jgi:hypothetical protein
MEYGDFEITVLAGSDGFEARVRRFDRRHFTMPGSDHPHMLHGHVDTPIAYETEEEAVKHAKLIADAAKLEKS